MTVQLSDEEIQNIVLSCLHKIAPEIDLKTLKKDQPLREQIDIDSLDFVRLVALLHENLKVDVPEADYAKLLTLNSCIDYFRHKIAGRYQTDDRQALDE